MHTVDHRKSISIKYEPFCWADFVHVCSCVWLWPSPVCMSCERRQRQPFFATLSHRSQVSFLPSSLSLFSSFSQTAFLLRSPFSHINVRWSPGTGRDLCLANAYTQSHMAYAWAHIHDGHQTIIYFRFTCGKWQVAATKSKYVWRMSPCVCSYELRFAHARTTMKVSSAFRSTFG